MSQVVIPLFDGESYDLWAIRMQTYLEGQDLWKVVEGDDVPLPENPTMVKKVYEDPHSNISQRSNATTTKSTINKEDDGDRRRKKKTNSKLNKDVISWKKEKRKNYKHKRRRKSGTKIWKIKFEDIKFK